MIYFLQSGDFLVKIGRAISPELRVAQLQTGNPQRLKLLGVIEANDNEERRLQAAFDLFRYDDEWYFLTKTIRSFIDAHCVPLAPKPDLTYTTIEGTADPQQKCDPSSVFSWFEECCIRSHGKRIRAGTAYNHYRTWCNWCGEPPVGIKQFGLAIKNGIRLRQSRCQNRTIYKDIILTNIELLVSDDAHVAANSRSPWAA